MRPDRRLRTLARRRGLCQAHSSRLWCVVCDYTWTGTDAELAELGALAQQSRADEAPLPLQRCARCGGEALCLDCAEAVFSRTPEHPDPLSPQQRARYDMLSEHLKPRIPDGP